MSIENEIKMCMLEKDIHALKSAEFEQKRLILLSKRQIVEAESRITEYWAQIEKKQAELASLEE